jgi:hypothetical protein
VAGVSLVASVVLVQVEHPDNELKDRALLYVERKEEALSNYSR